MRWVNRKNIPGNGYDDLRDWHPWFAWYPVKSVDGKTFMWLETVERRYLFSYGWDTQHHVWEYR